MEFRVWAPKAQKLLLQVDGRSLPMHSVEGGWWQVDAPEAGPGSDYGYRIDGAGPFPDPRSPWQPQDVHGLSRWIDRADFQWSDAGFQASPLASGIIYELHVGTFTPEGTFESAVQKLDDLRDLGITHVEIMPVGEFPGRRGWGYDGVDLYAPEHTYGGPQGMQRFVNACHALGLGVILDVVYNHLGPSGNYLDRFGPYHSEKHHTSWGEGLNFDGPGSDEVRRFFLDNARTWLRDYHIDGLRLDAIHALLDESAVHFLEELSHEVDQLEIETGRHMILTAESDLNDPRVVRPLGWGGYGLEAQWSDDFHHALHVLLTGEQNGYYADYQPWEDLAKTLTQVFAYTGQYSVIRGKRHGRPVNDLPGYRFIGFSQNHDQIGNRAQGDRLVHLVGPELAKVAAAIVLTAPFVPLLFMGEEWGASTPFLYFTDHEAELGKAVSEGRRSEFAHFGWQPEQVPDPQADETFLRSKLNWLERTGEPHASILAWYKALIALRRSTPTLTNGRLEDTAMQSDAQAGWLVIQRGPLRLACNIKKTDQEAPLPQQTETQLLLASNPRARLTDKGVFLPAESAAVIR